MEKISPEPLPLPVALEGDSSKGETSSALTLLSYPVGLVTGFQAAKTWIGMGSYKNLAKQELFGDVQQNRTAQYRDAVQKQAAGQVVDMPAEARRIEQEYHEAVGRKFETLGYRGIGDHWKGLQRRQRVESVMIGATVAGVTIGALLTILRNSHWLSSLLGGDDKKTDQQQR